MTVGDESLLLAVDGGNSKLDLVVLREDGTVLGMGRGGGAPFTLACEQASLEAVETAFGEACSQAGLDPARRPVAALGVFCLAGADLPVDDRRILRALRRMRLARELVLRNDTFAVLRAGTERPWGVGVVCGAGMNCSAVAPDGRVVRFASLGEVSGDDGGGGWLGMQAIRAAVRGRDGRDERTALERLVPAHFGVRSTQAVLELIQTGKLDPYPVELAPVVFGAAGDGDAVARRLLDHLADEIVLMVASAARRLRLTRRDPDVVLGGGVFRAGDGCFLARVTDGVHAVVPAARVTRLEAAPVAGAALLALDRAGASRDAAARVRAALAAGRPAAAAGAPTATLQEA